MPPPFSSYADFMLFSFSFAVSTAAVMTVDIVFLIPLNALDTACPIPESKNLFLISVSFPPVRLSMKEKPAV